MVPPACREVLSGARPPAQEALHQARQKAASLVSRFPDALILGSDTLINLDGRLIGKPSSPGDARGILQRLRGRTHDVVTAVSILYQSKTVDAVETARVTMRDFTDRELDAYLATGDRKSTRLNSSHDQISYAVFCLKKKKRSYDSSSRS